MVTIFRRPDVFRTCDYSTSGKILISQTPRSSAPSILVDKPKRQEFQVAGSGLLIFDRTCHKDASRTSHTFAGVEVLDTLEQTPSGVGRRRRHSVAGPCRRAILHFFTVPCFDPVICIDFDVGFDLYCAFSLRHRLLALPTPSPASRSWTL